MTGPKFTDAKQAMAYYTDCNLATLTMLAERKGSSKSAIQRQRNICLGMLSNVDGDTAAQMTAAGIHVNRVLKMLESGRREPEGLSGAVDRFIQEIRDDLFQI